MRKTYAHSSVKDVHIWDTSAPSFINYGKFGDNWLLYEKNFTYVRENYTRLSVLNEQLFTYNIREKSPLFLQMQNKYFRLPFL